MRTTVPLPAPAHGIELTLSKLTGLPADRLAATWMRRAPEELWLAHLPGVSTTTAVVDKRPGRVAAASRVSLWGRAITIDSLVTRRSDRAWDVLVESPVHGVRATYAVHEERDASRLVAHAHVFARNGWLRPTLDVARGSLERHWDGAAEARITRLGTTWSMGAPLERLPATL